MADPLLYLFGFSCFAYIELAIALLVRSNPLCHGIRTWTAGWNNARLDWLG